MIRVNTAQSRRGMICVFVAALTAMLTACSNATTASSATEGSDIRYDVEHVQKSLEALEARRPQESGATQVDTDATAESMAELLPYIGLPKTAVVTCCLMPLLLMESW